MPRMAPRCGASRTTGMGPSRRTASAVVSAVVLGAPLVVPTSGSASVGFPETVTLPAAGPRLLDVGIAGWTASYGVTATGCADAPCPTLQALWVADSGVAGLGDGALAVTVRSVRGHDGVAVATLRSPVFVAPEQPLSAAFAVATRTVVAGPRVGVVHSTLTVRLVDAASGERRTIVDTRPSAPAGDPWTDVRSDQLSSGALLSSGAYRLEIEVRFALSADDAPDTTVLIDRPTLSVQTASKALPPAPFDLPAVDESAPAPAVASVDVADPPGAVEGAACEDPVTVLGASGVGRRLTVAGVAETPAGGKVQLISPDGWALGTAPVNADGEFAAELVTPRAAGPMRFVLARTEDGEESPVVRVQRLHVLRGVRTVGGKIVVDGNIAGGWAGRRGRATLDLLVPAEGPCGDLDSVRVGTVAIDRRTGRYHATLAEGAPGFEEVRGAHVVSARLMRPDSARAHARATSPLTPGPASDTQEAGP